MVWDILQIVGNKNANFYEKLSVRSRHVRQINLC